jgi:hypothetical protein
MQDLYAQNVTYGTTSMMAVDLANNPLNFGPGRNVRVGLGVEF